MELNGKFFACIVRISMLFGEVVIKESLPERGAIF
jgi:hypothetical protein